jgi:hypothetical protein
MSEQEIRDIIAFLHRLTAQTFDRTIPERCRAGFRPGGAFAETGGTQRPAPAKIRRRSSNH